MKHPNVCTCLDFAFFFFLSLAQSVVRGDFNVGSLGRTPTGFRRPTQDFFWFTFHRHNIHTPHPEPTAINLFEKEKCSSCGDDTVLRMTIHTPVARRYARLEHVGLILVALNIETCISDSAPGKSTCIIFKCPQNSPIHRL